MSYSHDFDLFDSKCLTRIMSYSHDFEIFERHWMTLKCQISYTYDFITPKNLSHKQNVLFYGHPRMWWVLLSLLWISMSEKPGYFHPKIDLGNIFDEKCAEISTFLELLNDVLFLNSIFERQKLIWNGTNWSIIFAKNTILVNCRIIQFVMLLTFWAFKPAQPNPKIFQIFWFK